VTTAAGQAFVPLIDARAAGRLLGVPHTWLLAQARAGLIPHHRLGHYVRFSAEDLRDWLTENKLGTGYQRPGTGGTS
jgi:excisionase family DNA binding protein